VNFIMQMSLRNLVRQKRRSILLGTAIAFGTMILIVANSFSRGISDVLFNKVMSFVSGHVSVGFSEKGRFQQQIFRDGERMIKLVRDNVPELNTLEEAIGIMARVVGNGKADNAIMVGVDLGAEASPEELKLVEENFKVIEGKFEDIGRTDVENPVLLSNIKADFINVKIGDRLKVRFTDINNQRQSARLTVTGIFKPANVFMQMPMFMEMKTLKKMAGYGPHDISQLYLKLKDPKKNAIPVADRIHGLMTPRAAVIAGEAGAGGRRCGVSVLGFNTDSASLSALPRAVSVVSGDSACALGKGGIFATRELADALGIRAGDTCAVTWRLKLDPGEMTAGFVVNAVVEAGAGAPALYVNEKDFYESYYHHWPLSTAKDSGVFTPAAGSPLAALAAGEWVLLRRSKTTKEFQEQYKRIAKQKFKGVAVDVRSMYESASAILNLEAALNIITLAAVMVLFFIILIGVVNTLRMTIRERTREIGTVRAIGMQKADVRNSFLMETGFLSLFAALAGTAAAFLVMAGLSALKIPTEDNPLSMLLVNGHLHFVPAAASIIGHILLIMAITVGTAWFPARRAANLMAAAALRHYE